MTQTCVLNIPSIVKCDFAFTLADMDIQCSFLSYRYYFSQLASQYESLKTQVTAYYDRVIEPMVIRLGETSEQVLTDLKTQLDNMQQKLEELRYTTASKWNGV